MSVGFLYCLKRDRDISVKTDFRRRENGFQVYPRLKITINESILDLPFPALALRALLSNDKQTVRRISMSENNAFLNDVFVVDHSLLMVQHCVL